MLGHRVNEQDIAGQIDTYSKGCLVAAPVTEPERRDFWEICEDRYQLRSTILTSQLPVSRWHEQIGDPTLADGILDRLVLLSAVVSMRALQEPEA
jgi:DNA replication protein DnaC